MPTLIARSGPLAGRRFELDDDEVVLGREDATITLSDEETSRRHAAIRVTAGVVVIEDLGSTNGTFVDGKRIDVATELSGGETIKLGQTVFDIEIVAAAPEPDAGATRMAARPEPIADPDRTAVSHQPPPAEAAPPAPEADPDKTAMRPQPAAPEPVAAEPDPDRTALRPRPAEPEPAPPEPIADPDRTAVRPRPPAPETPPPAPETPPPAPEAPPPAPIADPDRTALRPRPGREPGREPAPAAASSAPPPPPAPPKPKAPARPPRGVAPAEEQPFGAFAPPAGRKRGGIATRKVAPSLVSFATIITTAVVLVIYFIGR